MAGVTLDIHTLFYAALAVVVGFHSMLFWVFAKVYGMREGIVPPDPHFTAMMRLATLEAGLIVGGVLLLFGLALGVYALGAWGSVEFGVLSPERAMRLVIPSGTAILLAFQIAYGAFLLSVLEIRSGGSAIDRYSVWRRHAQRTGPIIAMATARQRPPRFPQTTSDRRSGRDRDDQGILRPGHIDLLTGITVW